MKKILFMFLLLTGTAFSSDGSRTVTVNPVAGSFEESFNLKLIQKICKKSSYEKNGIISLKRDKNHIELFAKANFSCGLLVKPPKIRFSQENVTLSVESETEGKIPSLCLCPIEMKFQFDIDDLVNDPAGPYIFERIYLVKDNAVIDDVKFPNNQIQPTPSAPAD